MTTKKTFLFLLFMLITLSLACSLPTILQQGNDASGGISDGLTENYTPSLGYTPTNPFNYSPEQMTVINKHGNPTRFTIIFTDIDRQETWYYDTLGYTVVFRNGIKFAERNETPQYQEGMYATMLGPNQFYRGMNIDEVVLSTGRNDITLVTLEGMEKESRLMYLAGLSVGLVNGRVNFVETIPAMTETLLTPEDFTVMAPPAPPEVNLGPEIQAAMGSYTYSTIIYKDLSVSNCTLAVSEFYLEGDTLKMVEDNILMDLTPIDEKKYATSKEGVQFTLKFTPTGYVYWGEDNGVLYEIYAIREVSDNSSLISNPGLSSEEEYNEGTHTYQVDLCQEGGAIQSYQTTMDINFPEGIAMLVESGSSNLFTRLGTNYFEDDEDDTPTLVFTDIGFVWHFENEQGDLFMIFTLLQ